MSDIDIAKPSLGILSVLSQGLSIFMKRLPLILGIAMVLGIGLNLFNFALFGDIMFSNPEAMFTTTSGLISYGVIILASIVVSTLITAVITLAAYDTHLGRPMRLGTYVSVGLKNFITLFLLSIITTIAMSIGFALLIVPGLIIYLMWIVVVPSVVVEHAGFGALSRSRELTKGYRWPILGLMVILIVVLLIIQTLLSAALGFGFTAAFTGTSGLFFMLFQGAVSSISYAIYACIIVMLYARLKEIKEGVGMSDLADVFS